MKSFYIKIAAFFFLTVLLSGNILYLHGYFHEETHNISHCQENDSDNDNHKNDNNAPCDICLIAFTFINLDYNNTPQLSLNTLNDTQASVQKKVLGYIESLTKQLYLNRNRNKAPPYLT